MTKPVSSASSRRGSARAFALVLVLIVVSVLALVTVGFLSSMSQERATASAFANKARAEQSAQAGVDTAMGVLRDYFKAFPDSATVWDTTQSVNPGKQATDADYNNDGTTLYFHAVSDTNNLPNPAPDGTDPTANTATGNSPNNVDGNGKDARQTFALPLVSGATVKPATAKDTALPALTVDSATAGGNSVDLNSRRSLNDNQGWLGTSPFYKYPSAAKAPKPVRVPWVEIKQQDGVAAGGIPSVIGRYAFWVEDESFRANVSYADGGQSPLVPEPTRRDNTTNAALNPTDLSLLGLLTFLGDTNTSSSRANLLSARAAYPGGSPSAVFPESRGYAHGADLSATTSNALRYLTTSQSSALNLSRHGTQRLNLNRVVPQAALPSNVTQATSTIQGQIDQIVSAIQYHTPSFQVPGTSPAQYSYYFGQRFFRTTSGTTSTDLNALQVTDDSTHPYSLIYLYKVAANIRDYIDSDPTPTIINAKGYVHPDNSVDPGGTVRYGTKPMHAFAAASGISSDGPNEIWAQGKDSAPFIEECATRLRGGHIATDPSKYRVAIDHYIEVWNPSNQDVKAVDLGPNPVLRVANPTQWISTSPVDPRCPNTDPAPATASPYDSRVKPPLRDYDIDLSGVTFKAGVATVITTDPNYAAEITGTEAQSHVYRCDFVAGSGGKRVFNGTLPFLSDGKTYAAGLKMVFGDSSGGSGFTTSSDYETEIILATDNGVVDCIEGGLPIYNGGSTNVYLTAATPADPNAPIAEESTPLFLGGSLRGNGSGVNYPDILGDPRSNNEQLEYLLYKGGASPPLNQTRYYNATAATMTLGLPNSTYVQPANGTAPYNAWGDYYTFPTDLKMTATNAPAMIANAALTSIGQLGDIYDPLRIGPMNYVYARGGGRTFKVGQHDDRWDGDAGAASRNWTSWRLADFFCVGDAIDQPGLININGVARDNGAALRAALTGFKFQSTTSSTGSTVQPAGKTLTVDTTSPGLQTVVDQIKARLATPCTSPATTYSKPPAASNLPAGSLNDHTGSGPFYERGELSELPALGRNAVTPAGTASTDLVSAVNMATAFDREREELLRRLVEMTTTRGNVFTVYATGQSIVPVLATDTRPRIVNGTHQLRVTFKLVPKDSGGGDFHPGFDATGAVVNLDPKQPNKRFAKPDHYEVQVLSASSGNG